MIEMVAGYSRERAISIIYTSEYKLLKNSHRQKEVVEEFIAHIIIIYKDETSASRSVGISI